MVWSDSCDSKVPDNCAVPVPSECKTLKKVTNMMLRMQNLQICWNLGRYDFWRGEIQHDTTTYNNPAASFELQWLSGAKPCLRRVWCLKDLKGGRTSWFAEAAGQILWKFHGSCAGHPEPKRRRHPAEEWAEVLHMTIYVSISISDISLCGAHTNPETRNVLVGSGNDLSVIPTSLCIAP